LMFFFPAGKAVDACREVVAAAMLTSRVLSLSSAKKCRFRAAYGIAALAGNEREGSVIVP